jgi:adenylate cyclase
MRNQENNFAFVRTLRRVFEQDFKTIGNYSLMGTSLEALIRPYEGPDNFYLNFYGTPGTAPTISYFHVFSGDDTAADSIDFRGKSVFVCRSELTKPVQEDTYPTVFGRDDGVDLSGVEIAATAFANMLKDQALRRAGPGLSASIVFALGASLRSAV